MTSESAPRRLGRAVAPPSVFVSHASADSALGDEVCRILESDGISCWIAPRDVEVGRDYSEQILDGIESTRVMVLLLSEHANRSTFVKNEVERAISKGKVVIPLRIQEVQPSRSLELFVSSTQWIDAWTPPLDSRVHVLAAAIRGLLRLPPLQEEMPAVSPAAEAPAAEAPAMEVPAREPQRPSTSEDASAVGPAIAPVAGFVRVGTPQVEAVRRPRRASVTPRVAGLAGIGVVLAVLASVALVGGLLQGGGTGVAASPTTGQSPTDPAQGPTPVPSATSAPSPTSASGQSATSASSAPYVAGPPSAAISAGMDHTCAIGAGGTVKCWGSNLSGQLGDGTTTDSLTPVAVSGLTGAIAVAVGVNHTCAIVAGGAAVCWGSNDMGQLGTAGAEASSPKPIEVSGLTGVTAISAAMRHTCALVTGGAVVCWGGNEFGQLGDGTTTASDVPVAVPGLVGATAVSASESHTCAIVANGAVKCWGKNEFGQLGDGTTTARLKPVAVASLSGATGISAGRFHTCVLMAGGTAKCWGNGYFGELGDGTTTGRPTPVAVTGLTGATAILVGNGGYTCALVPDGAAKCWGQNDAGQLGDGTTTNKRKPVAVSGLTGATAITAGYSHTCALVSDAGMKCWGANNTGQLGDGSTTNRTTPVPVQRLN